jgi:hypothetical protein
MHSNLLKVVLFDLVQHHEVLLLTSLGFIVGVLAAFFHSSLSKLWDMRIIYSKIQGLETCIQRSECLFYNFSKASAADGKRLEWQKQIRCLNTFCDALGDKIKKRLDFQTIASFIEMTETLKKTEALFHELITSGDVEARMDQLKDSYFNFALNFYKFRNSTPRFKGLAMS